ncbi:conjugative transposon protein TraM [Sphingobacterium thalpophilum]|uniref:Bacteroides conjugative transposon TraM protein n=1 Tax=Sphingobacterium thalpophilum TaxID=259 RepID=A0A4U9V6A2_9SPHI|nr:conjugative transposon protein TraM [Sphingobacterium thalpophilum]VTR41217.1 Bacteroides conjugative transposon TraM protein [Sphingobacterium thalpophilum]
MEQRKKKALLVLPLIFVPIMALIFYALGGGRGTVQDTPQTTGINTALPDASFRKDEATDKASLYRMNQNETDPEDVGEEITEDFGFDDSTELEERTAQISEKLDMIEKRLQEPEVDRRTISGQRASGMTLSEVHPLNTSLQDDVDRLEQLMKNMQEDSTPDPETEQLNDMLRNILDIQHPERVANRERMLSDSLTVDSVFRAIPATVLDKKRVVQGATVRLRLEDTVTIDGFNIPRGHEVFGIARIANQRLLVNVTNIRLGTSIIPVNFAVYGLDGIEGLDAPEAVISETANMGADRAISGIGLYGLDNSLTTQLAGAGIDAARSAVSKRLRKIKVRIKAGEQVLLRIKR